MQAIYSKRPVISPLVKKSTLDKNDLANCTPVQTSILGEEGCNELEAALEDRPEAAITADQ